MTTLMISHRGPQPHDQRRSTEGSVMEETKQRKNRKRSSSAEDDDEAELPRSRLMTTPQSTYRQKKLRSSDDYFGSTRSVTRSATKSLQKQEEEQQQQQHGEGKEEKQQHGEGKEEKQQHGEGKEKQLQQHPREKLPDRREFTDEELEVYKKKCEESEGFDVGDYRDDILMNTIMPISLDMPDCELQHLNEIAELALQRYNKKNCTDFKFLKLIRLNGLHVAGWIYYITFHAEANAGGSPPLNFQTLVHDFLDKRSVYFCRVEKKLKVPKGPGETSQLE